MDILVAESAGFCFGVKRAVGMVYDLISQGIKVCTLGLLIHNKYVVDKLKKSGVIVVENIHDVPQGYTLVVRSHGVPESYIDYLEKNSVPYVDATCPFVKKIHTIVKRESLSGRKILIAGDSNHPEVIGIKGFCNKGCIVFKDYQELEKICKNFQDFSVIDVTVVAQTTFDITEWKKCVNLIQNLFTKPIIYDTICNTTQLRQKEAKKLSNKADCMLVIGGKNSSNTKKLYNICKKYCNTLWIESYEELNFTCFRNCRCVGITAGASTPEEIIEEVKGAMVTNFESENGESENFEKLLEESFKENDNGCRVKGTVVGVNPSEVYVDVGRKQSGVIPKSEFTNDPNLKLEDVVKVGDELELLIMRTDDQEGTITLSKLKVDASNQWNEIVKSYNSKEVLKGVVCKVVKSGILVACKSFNVFIPLSHVGGNKSIPLESYINKNIKFKIIEIDDRKRRIVGSIREVKNEEKKLKLEEFWSGIEVGKVYKGIVSSITSYAAFVDLGSIDGMVHMSELTWDREKKPSDVVSVGQEIEVKVKSFDKDKGKVSLSYKKEEDNPWVIIKKDYPVGTVFDAEIVSIVPFGAFAKVIPGIDGLIHISQISDKRIESPKEVLSVGQKVKVKVREIDGERRRLSLTMRDLEERN